MIERLLYMNPSDGKRYKGEHEIPFYSRQHRLVLANCTIEPDSIGEYFHKKGYLAADAEAAASRPEENGNSPLRPPDRKNMLSATVTRATRERLWTVPSWKAIRTP